MPAITVLKPREEVERLWDASELEATFKDAPGDRGTEIHVASDDAGAKDVLRRFKQKAETGEVPVVAGQPRGTCLGHGRRQRG